MKDELRRPTVDPSYEINKRFGYHKANDQTIPLHGATRAHFIWLATWVTEFVPAGREQTLALTALQEAAMWSNAGIACNLAPLT